MDGCVLIDDKLFPLPEGTDEHEEFDPLLEDTRGLELEDE